MYIQTGEISIAHESYKSLADIAQLSGWTTQQDAYVEYHLCILSVHTLHCLQNVSWQDISGFKVSCIDH